MKQSETCNHNFKFYGLQSWEWRKIANLGGLNSGLDSIDQSSQDGKATAIELSVQAILHSPPSVMAAFFYSSSPHGLCFLHRAARHSPCLNANFYSEVIGWWQRNLSSVIAAYRIIKGLIL